MFSLIQKREACLEECTRKSNLILKCIQFDVDFLSSSYKEYRFHWTTQIALISAPLYRKTTHEA